MSDPLLSTPPISYIRSIGIPMIRRLSGASQTESTSAHPLSSSVDSNTSSNSYAVYSSKKASDSIVSNSNTNSTSLELNQPPHTPLSLLLPPTPSSPSTSEVPSLLSKPSTSLATIEANNVNNNATSLPPPPPRRTLSTASVSLVGQNLKAELQKLGLNSDSTGYAIVNKLANLGREPEWKGIVNAVGSGKITLLLPKERMSEAINLSPTFFLDHLVIIDPPIASTSFAPSSSIRGFATLSGFRGTIDSEELIFASCGSLLSESSTGILKNGSLHPPNLADINLHSALSGSAHPTTFISNLSPITPFSSIALLSTITDLSIPRMLSIAADRRKEALGRQASSTGSRLAALFAKTPPSTPSSSTSLDPTSSPTSLSTPTIASKVDTLDSSSNSPDSYNSKTSFIELPVVSIEKIIKHPDMIQSISASIDSYLKSEIIKIEGCDEGIVENVCSFVSRFQPPKSWLNSFPPSGGRTLPLDSLFGKSIEEVSDSMQDLLHEVRDELGINIRTDFKDGKAKGTENEEENYGAIEEKIDESLESIEEFVLTTLYDRIFCPPSSGDSQEDENLSSRIAALNLLDLSLEHLGLDLGGRGTTDESVGSSRNLKENIEDIIRIAGKELSKLQDSNIRSPKAKINIFVNLHKIIVDGFSTLPPIPLKDHINVEAVSGMKVLDIELDDTSSKPSSMNNQSLEESRSESPSQELASSVHEATNSSFFDSEPEPHVIVTAPVDILPSATNQQPIKLQSPSTSSADLILPLLIYLIVKYNQPRIYSNLLYVQRFRSESLMRGEGAYCSTNIHAVIEFLNHVDMADLGLSSQNISSFTSPTANDDIISTTPTSIPNIPKVGSPLKLKLAGVSSRVTKENLSQEVDQFIDNANGAIFQVTNSMRSLFSPQGLPKTLEDVKMVLDGAGNSVANKAKGTLLRRTASGNNVGEREMIDIVPGGELPMDNGEDDFRFLDSKPSISDRLAAKFNEGKSNITTSGTSTPTKSALFSFGTRPASIVASTSTATIESSTLKPISKFMQLEVSDLTIREVEELLNDYKRIGTLVNKSLLD